MGERMGEDVWQRDIKRRTAELGMIVRRRSTDTGEPLFSAGVQG